jgi:hypothetical protein
MVVEREQQVRKADCPKPNIGIIGRSGLHVYDVAVVHLDALAFNDVGVRAEGSLFLLGIVNRKCTDCIRKVLS